MSKIIDNVLVSSLDWDWDQVKDRLDKPFVEALFDEAREALLNYGEDRPWLIDAASNERSFIRDIEPQTRKLAAVFRHKVRNVCFLNHSCLPTASCRV